MKLIKTLLIAFVFGSMVLVPAVSLAVTSSPTTPVTNASLQAQIDELMKVVAQLQAQLTAMNQPAKGLTNTVAPIAINLPLPSGTSTIIATDSDKSPDYTNGTSYQITPERYPDLFIAGVSTGDYVGGGPCLYGVDPNPTNCKPTDDNFTTYYDHCFDSKQLNEGFIRPDGRLSAFGFSAPDGYICEKGRYISNTTTTPTITVLSPNGGEQWEVGKTYKISWAGSNITSTSNLEVMLVKEDLSGGSIFSGLNISKGEVLWTIPQTINSGKYYIELWQIDSTHHTFFDRSDAPFSIVATSTTPTITVLSPNGGERVQVGKTYPITWKSQNSYKKVGNKVRILLRNYKTGVNTTIVTVDSPDNIINTYKQTIPTNFSLGDYVIHIEYTDITECPKGVLCKNDDSDAPFSIVAVGTPIINVLSPNGGETWTKGTGQTIKWQDSTPTVCLSAVCTAPTYDIRLLNYYPPCTTRICPAYVVAPYTIAKYTSGSSYNWSVGKVMDVNGNVITAPDGSYTVQVCQASTLTCDSSNSYFKIVSGSIVNNPPKITTESTMPSNVQPGQSVSFSWLATDADNDNLSWEIAWGDGTGEKSICQTPNPKNGQNWKFTASHAWSKAGAYPVKVQVNDCSGGGDSRAFIVNVGDVVNPTITVLSPNGGEKYEVGQTILIKWTQSNIGQSLPLSVRIYKGVNNYDNPNYVQYIVNNGLLNQQLSFQIPSSAQFGTDYFVGVGTNVVGLYANDSSDAPFSIVSSANDRLIISVDTTIPAKASFLAGSSGVDIARFKFSSPVQSPVTLRNFSFSNFVNTSNGFMPTNSSDLINFSLWDGSIKVGQTVVNSGTYGLISFLNTNWYIPAGTSKLLTLRADISSTAKSGNQHEIQLSGFDYPEDIRSNWGEFNQMAPAFTITTTPTITVLSPNGGEKWEIGSTHTIQWTSTSAPADASVYLTALIPSGQWVVINGNGMLLPVIGSYSWTIPSSIYSPAEGTFYFTPGTNYKIKVNLQTSDNLITSVSNSFSIVSATIPMITVLSPNGGEKYAQGSKQSIKFKTNVTGDGVVCFHLLRNNVSLMSIGCTPNNTGSYELTIPTTLAMGDGYKIFARVTDISGKIISDYSDAPFSVVSLTAPITATNTNTAQMASTLEILKALLKGLQGELIGQ